MTHAVLIQVKLDPNSEIGHRHTILNDLVIPEVKALSGFQKGMWMNDDGGTGTCVVMFDSEDNARTAVGALTPVDGPPVLSSSVCRVEIEA